MKSNSSAETKHRDKSKSPYSSAEESASNNSLHNGTLAERRAIHNSVERTRREALNAKFTLLAQTIPSLQHVHRPSKSTIISHCLDMTHEMREMKLENLRLRQELESLGAVRYMNGASGLSRHSSMSAASASLSPPILHTGSAAMRAPGGIRKGSLGMSGPDEYGSDPNHLHNHPSNVYRNARGPLAAGLSLYVQADDYPPTHQPFNTVQQHAPGLLRLPLGSAVVDRESSREEGVDSESTPVARHAPRLSFAGYAVGEGELHGHGHGHATQQHSREQREQHHHHHQHHGSHGHSHTGQQQHGREDGFAPDEMDEPMHDYGRHGQEQQPVYHSQYASHSLGEYH
ncbi:hypothetical protein BCR37DRAFT_189 [Protomyces lactucae-debilis]|uniref:BHLH domain-containing protein n=1 Tax=Protomyces lactucae-debilis TaxID=2754530 RepID=A0A1Y2FU98_PROLT|nr:uncharacterized protein BCR37DRAFT_189 [Protomyces lactucae-debilis]ORY87558.1 hypothetical protein BCR37DRAFT_189 [Protomyces lactucae-debilis]